MPIFQAHELTDIGRRILEAAGAPPKIAQQVSESLVTSNLVGLDSHGVIRLVQYVEEIKEGQIIPQAEPGVVIDAGSIAVVDGHHGFGQVIASRGIEIAIDKARVSGIGITGLRRTNHIGRLGEYLLKAVKAGFVGFATCNGGGPNVAPFGSKNRVFGTNPIACAVPVREGYPILIDTTTGAAAEGKIRVARNRKEQVPQGILINNKGEPSTDPNDFYAGGAILPIGGHKGSALSLMVEILGGILTGAGCSAFPDYDGGNGVLFIVIDPACFRDTDFFLSDVERMQEKIKSSPPASGFSEVLLPGEPEFRSEEKRREEGIPIDAETWKSICTIAEQLGVDLSSLKVESIYIMLL